MQAYGAPRLLSLPSLPSLPVQYHHPNPPENPLPSNVDRELENLIRARYPLIYVVSWEEKRVEDALRSIARERGKKLHIWTVTQGFPGVAGQRDHTTREPLVALDYILNSSDQAIFLLKDFHSFIADFNV